MKGLGRILVRMQKPIPYKKLIILSGLVVVILAGLLGAQRIFRDRETRGPAVAPHKESLTIFLPAREGLLVRRSVETKEGLTDREKTDVIMRELRMGNAVPDKLTLRQFSLNGEGILYLNLSADIKDERMSGADQITTVYAIVNSFLANIREARSVQLLIEGQALHTINGVVYTYAPIEFNNQLLEE
jgi:hypothetical protein